MNCIMKSAVLRVLVLFSCGITVPCLAESAPLTFGYYARVNSVSDPYNQLPLYGVGDGSLATALVTIDPDYFEHSSDESYYGPAASGAMTITVGSLLVTSALNFTFVTRTADSVKWHLEYENVFSNATASYIDSVVIQLISHSPHQVPTGTTLFDYYDPTLWDAGHLSLNPCCGGLNFYLSAEMTHTEAVPEPASWLLLVCGISIAMLLKRTKNDLRNAGIC